MGIKQPKPYVTPAWKRLSKYLLRRRLVDAASRFPNRMTVECMRRICGIQMTTTELIAVVRAVKSRSSCRLLVFGLGNDSLFWQVMNRGGTTAFIEDNVQWMEKVRLRDRLTFTTSTQYNTQLRDWRTYFSTEADLNLPLDPSISDATWDVILVDGPAAWCDDVPGRMKSIAATKHLVRPGGDVFVHDFDRQPEHDLALHFLGRQNHRSTSDKLAHFVLAESPCS